MSAKPDYVVSKLTRPTGGVATGGFVINLTSSTTPMALSQPKDPTLAQFTFFVSRRLEDGRERFRLHMGYFETIQAAEEMLVVVRDVYPGAWASEAPGKKLRGGKPQAAAAPTPATKPVAATPAPAPVAQVRAAAPTPPAPQAEAPAQVAATPHPFASTPPPAELKYETEPEPFLLTDEPEFIPANIPVVQPPAQPVASAPPPVAAAKPAAKLAAARAAARPPAKPAVAPARPAPAKAATPSPSTPAKPTVAAKPATATKPATPAQPVAAKPTAPAKPPMLAPKIAAKVTAPALHASAPAPKVQAPEPTVQMPAMKPQPMSATPSLTNVRQVIEELDDLSDTQTIRLLERHTPYREGSQEASADEAIRVIKPEDAQ
jgi:hypothetical protein